MIDDKLAFAADCGQKLYFVCCGFKAQTTCRRRSQLHGLKVMLTKACIGTVRSFDTILKSREKGMSSKSRATLKTFREGVKFLGRQTVVGFSRGALWCAYQQTTL